MHRFIPLTALIALATAGGGVAAEDDLAPRVAASKAAVMAFAGELKGELQAAMKAEGAVHAIAVCNERAPEIGAAQSEAHGLNVGGWPS